MAITDATAVVPVKTGSAREGDTRDSRTADAREFVDRRPATLRRDATLRQAAELLIAGGAWGVPVLDEDGCYFGFCTARSLLACSLPVRPDTLAPGAGLDYVQHGGETLRERLLWDADRPVRDLIDLEVPAVRESTSLPQLLILLGRRGPMLPIVADTGPRLIGIASWDRALKAIWHASP